MNELQLAFDQHTESRKADALFVCLACYSGGCFVRSKRVRRASGKDRRGPECHSSGIPLAGEHHAQRSPLLRRYHTQLQIRPHCRPLLLLVSFCNIVIIYKRCIIFVYIYWSILCRSRETDLYMEFIFIWKETAGKTIEYSAEKSACAQKHQSHRHTHTHSLYNERWAFSLSVLSINKL